MAGLFDTFTIAKRGLNVQQANINTTSHNIANASTTGYSRQRAVVETTRPFGGMSRFDSCSAGQVGTGAEVTTIQRIRDVFKDYQVRNQKTEYGTLDVKNQYLTQTEDILNETSDAGIQDSLSEFYAKFNLLSVAPEKSSNKTVAVQTAAALANALNNRYTQLETTKSDAQAVLQTDVTNINSILNQINALNKQITGVSAVGMTPNDLMDTRDNLLDELSTKFGITTQREKYESLDVTTTLGGNTLDLVDGKDLTGANCNRLSYVESANVDSATGTLKVTYSVLGDKSNQKSITIQGTTSTADIAKLEAIKKELTEKRILVGDKDGILNGGAGTTNLTGLSAYTAGNATISLSDYTTSSAKVTFAVDKGEIGGNQSVQTIIQNTMDELDKFAAGLAYSVNAIQTGSTDGTANANLANNDPLFVTKGSTTDTGISAKTITVNSVIQNDATKLNCGITSADTSGEKAGTRALAIANILSLKIDLTKIDVTATSTRADFYNNTPTTGSGLDLDAKDLYLVNSSTGVTLDNKYKSIISNLATKAKAVTTDLTGASTQLESFENERLSESGVSLDEETANLIQYQHAYQANAKVMSTIDELLDVVINGLKR